MPPMTITLAAIEGSKKLLNYLEYTKNYEQDAHVQMLQQVIKINRMYNESTKNVHIKGFNFNMGGGIL
jgi:hypothetical protein